MTLGHAYMETGPRMSKWTGVAGDGHCAWAVLKWSP